MAEDARNPNASRPPSGKPRKTLIRDSVRSRAVQRSSTAPEEKKNTS